MEETLRVVGTTTSPPLGHHAGEIQTGESVEETAVDVRPGDVDQ
jgi:hypothetical protein